jgi:hypothetical protein
MEDYKSSSSAFGMGYPEQRFKSSSSAFGRGGSKFKEKSLK